MIRTLTAVLALVLLARPMDPAAAQAPDAGTDLTLGVIEFPTTGESAEAEREFELGVLALHSFWYEEALEHFRRARALDPGLAMAYWGEAMAHDHPLWGRPPDTASARQVLAELEASGADRPGRLSERERAYLDAVRALYAAEGEMEARRVRFAERMGAVAERWPQDQEARLFAALYGMAAPDWSGRDSADVERVAAVLEDLFARNPRHPGAAHYLIHAYDSPEFARRGLGAARAYAAIAPSSSHALHMPSHIFFELGMWEEAVASNRDAWDASVAWVEREGRSAAERDFHALGWWIYALAQQGRFTEARARIAAMDSLIAGLWAATPPDASPPGEGAMLPLLATSIRTSFARDARAAGVEPGVSTRTDPALLKRVRALDPDMAVFELFTRARTAHGDDARDVADRLAPILSRVPPGARMPVHLPLLPARAALADGDTAAALAAYDSAVAKLVAQPRVLPHIMSDLPREERGALLLELGRARAALGDYEAVLEHAPRRPRALLGAARAAAALGERAGARRYYGELLDVWEDADPRLPAAEEARRYLDRPGGAARGENDVPQESVAGPEPRARALANDNRTAAGRLIDGELRVEMEAVEAEWYPRGDDGPRILTPAFAEVGGQPSVPGPLIRAAAGTPVRVAVHNRLGHPIEVRGLGDRVEGAPGPAGMPAGFPAFLFGEPLVVPPGESRVTRFVPSADVSSFYFGRVVPPETAPGADARPRAAPFVPGGAADEGAFVGAVVVDPADAPPAPDERLFVLTRWGSPDEPGSLATSWKMMINGRSWPWTERIDLAVGDTARWRVINTTLVDHPMHLHGFYFTVDATGDTQADTVFPPGTRREVVTEVMQELSSLRLTWVPERPGNWLFHCHLVRHSGEIQRFQLERGLADAAADAGPADHGAGADDSTALMDMPGMAGMILGVTVRPRDGTVAADPSPVRRIDLWTGSRPGVLDDAPELGFVVQTGPEPPAPDSTVVPGSPLVLTRGEPTEIVVHNRLDLPLALHWHGLEIRSLYDGVAHWSGVPGGVRPPIPPSGSQRVVIAPPRAGTFFYHTHGETGHELAQGLYGPFLVFDPGHEWDRDRDRVFVLGSRGARIDAPPAVNGRVQPGPERFEPGRTYRLRFIHISPDEYKRVRLLRDGEPVRWTPWAKDGADLPPERRAEGVAQVGIGVGEAYDVQWSPQEPGVYVLEVRTSFYPSRGGSAVQRVAFGVGEVTADALERATRGEAAGVELTADERRRYVGTYTGRLLPVDDSREFVFAVWEQGGRLYSSTAPRGEAQPDPSYLVPLGDGVFMPGAWEEGLVTRVREDVRIRFVLGPDPVDMIEIEQDGATVFRFERAESFRLTDEELQAFVGVYGGADVPVDTDVSIVEGTLRMRVPGQPEMGLLPVAFGRFRVAREDRPGAFVVFEMDGGRATALVWSEAGFSFRVERKGGS